MGRFTIWMSVDFGPYEPLDLGWYFTEAHAQIVLDRLEKQTKATGNNRRYKIYPN